MTLPKDIERHYYIRNGDQPEREVTKEIWVGVERVSGFNGGVTEEPATAGFGTGSITGRIEYRRTEMTTEEMIKQWNDDTTGQYDRAVFWASEEEATQDDVERLAEVSTNIMEEARELIGRLVRERETSFTMEEINDALSTIDAPREHWTTGARIVLDDALDRKHAITLGTGVPWQPPKPL